MLWYENQGVAEGDEFLMGTYCIVGCYYTLCHNTYGYSLLFYKVYYEEGECRQLGFWAGKGANIGNIFCIAPKVLKLQESQFWNILKILGKESTRGGPPTVHEGGGRALPLGAPPASWATWKPPDAHLLV